MIDVSALIASPIFAGQVRHLMTALAGALVTAGALQSDQQNAFATIASGLVVYLLGAVWSFWQKRGQAIATAALAAEVQKLERLAAIYKADAKAGQAKSQ